MKVVWTRPAKRDLEAIGDYIARDNAKAAAQVVIRVLDQAELLTQHPHAGRAGRIAGTRELVVTNTPFVLPYRVREDCVEILSVFHSSRKWPERFD